MNHSLFKLTTPFILAVTATAQDTHISIANEIINLLSDTEICLNLCRDEQSINEVIPVLRELAVRACDIKERQNKLSDLTPAEDKEIAKLIPQFITLQKAIKAHLLRLHTDNLFTPELEEVLTSNPNFAPTTE